MPDNSITVTGGVVRDPELQFLNAGTAVVKFTVAVSRKWQNRQTQEWEERTSFFDVKQYGKPAENAANTLKKGYRVTVHGYLEQRTWETPEGDKRSVIEINAEDVAVSLRFVTAELHRAPSESGPRSSSSASAAPASYDDEPF